MWSPGKTTGSMPSARASAVDVRSQTCPADSSPMPTTIRSPRYAGRRDRARTRCSGASRGGRRSPRRRPRALRGSSEHLGEHRLGQLDVGVGQEQPPGRRPPLGQVCRDDRVGHRPPLLAVLEQFVERRLVGDHGVHQVGSRLGQGQHGDRTAAGPERRRRAEVEVGQQPGHVVGAHRGVESWSRSATELRWMARGSMVTTVWSLGQQVGERGEGVGVHRRPEQQHRRPGAADLVVEPGAGDVQVSRWSG